MRFGELGSFDSLNPFVRRGTAPWPLTAHVYQTLMMRSYHEPFTLYPGVASAIEVPADRSAVHFTLAPRARFSDGSPVTVEDVIWSLETLGREGSPRYGGIWSSVASIQQTGERRVSVTFNTANRELPLLIALRPVLKKTAPWTEGLQGDPMVPPIGSGPYVVAEVEPGRRVVFQRVADWWAADLPASRGLHNPDRLVYEYFRTDHARFEALAAGEIDIMADADPVRWATGYDIAPVRDGRLVRSTLPHARPSGMRGFVFNTRRPPLDDRRVREALGLMFDFAWINERLYAGAYRRIGSYFSGSALGFEGPAEGAERALLAPFADTLPEGTLEGTALWPPSAGTGRDRRAQRRATRLLQAAGYRVVDGRLLGTDGEALALGVLVTTAEDAMLAGLWADALQRLGVTLDIRRVDPAQFAERRRAYDYDIVVNRWAMSRSPGTEQRLYFGAYGREEPDTRNFMGVADPAVDAMIDAMLAAEDAETFQAAVRALDRVLTAGLYVVPFGVLPDDRVAHAAWLRHPEPPEGARSLYGWFGWWSGPGVWWVER
ncbi:MAG: extracellular solute-binding protein [Pseudomonadota bacterium]